MNTSLKKPEFTYKKGDPVIWSNPDLEWDNSTYCIVDILSTSGSVTDVDTVIVIESENGRTSEVFVSEIH
jgi:hypothetical protein